MDGKLWDVVQLLKQQEAPERMVPALAGGDLDPDIFQALKDYFSKSVLAKSEPLEWLG
ncbi:MAG: hypothetical protein LKI94_01120 [Sporolactobacillus sp.]|nr:hypothetical protein [Sporolactobacillus sp.]MCI1880777.1 hypothetical protein [Sporolactobacillus sp.]